MAEVTDAERVELATALANFNSRAEALMAVQPLNEAKNINRFEFKTGNAAAWIACLGAAAAWYVVAQQGNQVAVMSSQIAAQSAQIAELSRKSDRLQDYLNAIYAQAPHLRPADYGQPEK
jgi:hypothetical protein